MSARTAQRARMDEAAAEAHRPFPSWNLGYLEGSVRSAIIQLEHGNPELALRTLRTGIERVG